MVNYLNGYEKKFCEHCKVGRTKEGHDGCIGTLENVMNACCGHGESNTAYVQFNHKDYKKEPNKFRLSGDAALKYINDNKVVGKRSGNCYNCQGGGCPVCYGGFITKKQ